MITLYKKVNKSADNPRGIQKVDASILREPCLICLSAQPKLPRSVFGIVREGQKAARLRTTNSKGAGFATDTFPVNFLAIESDRGEYSKDIAELLFGLVSDADGNKISVSQASKNLRNINIMAYCDGNLTYLQAEKELVPMMQNIGYTAEEISSILGSIAVIGIATNRDVSASMATYFQIHDLNDVEVIAPMNMYLKNSLSKKGVDVDTALYKTGDLLCFYNGSGDHSIKSVIDEYSISGLCTSIIVIDLLKNSVKSHNSKGMDVPIDSVQICVDLERVFGEYKKGIPPYVLLNQIDRSLQYPGARKLSEEEISLLNEIDKMCKSIIETSRLNSTMQIMLDNEQGKNDRLLNAVQEFTSDMTRMKILQRMGWNFTPEEIELISKAPSDRELVEKTIDSDKKQNI